MLRGKILFTSALVAGICIPAFSQEQLGLRLTNYSGINATMLNPAFNVGSPLRWDVNIIAAGVFAENNYIYIKDANLFKVLSNRTGFSYAGNNNSETPAATEGLQYDFTTGDRKKEALVNAFVTGPSAMFHIKEHTFGIFFNARAVTSTNHVPSSLGYYDLDALQTGDVPHVEPFRAAGMAWSEIGLNYGRNIISKKRHLLNGGITFKLLQGYEAAYFENHEATNITIEQDYMTYDQAHVTFGTSTGAIGYGDAAQPYNFKMRGFGGAVDIGAVYMITSKSKKRPYDWKMGVSLLDIGKIKFTKDAQAHEIDSDAPFDFIQGQYPGVENFADVYRVLSTQSLDDPNISLTDDNFSVWTPAAITVFAERSLSNHFFINALMVRRLSFLGAMPERDNIWAITPRFESRWFEASLPLVLYNDRDFRLGTAVRLGPLTVGTDNIISWFGSQDFTGSDVYVALKLNPFNLKKGTGFKQKRAPTNPNECFDFEPRAAK